MSKHTEYAQALAGLYRRRKSLQIELDHQGKDLDARVLAITPPDGWPGKNEGERKISREITIADDATCRVIAKQITSLRDELAGLEGEIEAVEAMRRAGEWETRERIATAFTFTDEPLSETHEPADAAFDKAADYPIEKDDVDVQLNDAVVDLMADLRRFDYADDAAEEDVAVPQDDFPF